MPISRPPTRFAASVPSGSVGNIGLRAAPSPQRSHAPTAAPPPTARTAPQGMVTSPHELVDESRAETDFRIMPAAHFDLGEHVLVAGLRAGFVEIDHRAADVEEGDHLGAILRDGERVDLARRLVDEAPLLRNPVVLEVAPATPDHVAEYRHRMPMPVQHARAPHA